MLDVAVQLMIEIVDTKEEQQMKKRDALI